MTERELQRWLRRSGLADAWWVSVDGEVLEEPRRLAELARMKRSSNGSLRILHVSQADNKEPPWITLAANKSRRRRSRKKKSRGVWIAAVITACVLVGVGVAVGLSKNDSADRALSVEREPPLRVRVGRSEWILYIFNGNVDHWQKVEIELKGTDRSWTYTWDNTLRPEGTLQIPFRDFMDDEGNRLAIKDGIPQKIKIVVPDYIEFEEKMR